LGVSSMPTWLDTLLDGFAKNEPSDWYVVAPSAVCRTMVVTFAPPRLE
jgi:hypothetical protein